MLLSFLMIMGAVGCSVSGFTDTTYRCGDQEVSLQALKEARSASELGPDGREALKGQEVRPIEDLPSWRIIEESDARVALMRELDVSHEQGQGTVGAHALLVVERFGPPGNDGRPGWHLRSSGHCDLRKDLGSLRAAEVTLDPAVPPGVEARKVHVLVTERGCASGKRADGRVRLAGIEQTPAEVRLVIGVEPLASEGVRTCQGNPPTPFTVELDEPLGDRALIDASVHPARRITGGRQ
ncbi:hypothetical protein Plo01_28530 [Planobispora longispora]|uniref:Uncharacterized protein n=1 Tax=Planobispora longispora TaxID=28887 RepID=A0A8J3RK60_9ACTN|nr:hypothetical protein Plo01_28530 [Planobispora longispora]